MINKDISIEKIDKIKDIILQMDEKDIKNEEYRKDFIHLKKRILTYNRKKKINDILDDSND